MNYSMIHTKNLDTHVIQTAKFATSSLRSDLYTLQYSTYTEYTLLRKLESIHRNERQCTVQRITTGIKNALQLCNKRQLFRHCGALLQKYTTFVGSLRHKAPLRHSHGIPRATTFASWRLDFFLPSCWGGGGGGFPKINLGLEHRIINDRMEKSVK